MRQESGGYRR